MGVNIDLLGAMVKLTVEDVIEERWEKLVVERLEEKKEELLEKLNLSAEDQKILEEVFQI